MPTYDISDIASGYSEGNMTEDRLRDVLHQEELTAPAADDMPIDDVIFQVVEDNGGEVVIITHDDLYGDEYDD